MYRVHIPCETPDGDAVYLEGILCEGTMYAEENNETGGTAL